MSALDFFRTFKLNAHSRAAEPSHVIGFSLYGLHTLAGRYGLLALLALTLSCWSIMAQLAHADMSITTTVSAKHVIAKDQRDSATAQDIVTCVQANLPQNSSSQTIKFVATDRANSIRTIQAMSWWQRSSASKARVNMRIIGPPDLADSSYLIAQSDDNTALFTYIPSLNKVQRISGRTAGQQLWGTDFSYEDMQYVQGTSFDGQYERIADAELQQRPMFVLQQNLSNDPNNTGIYKQIISHVDQETCVTMQFDFYTKLPTSLATTQNPADQKQVDQKQANQKPSKSLLVDSEHLRQINSADGTYWVATQMLMQDWQESTRTTLNIDAIEYEPKLSSSLFNPQRFHKAKP